MNKIKIPVPLRNDIDCSVLIHSTEVSYCSDEAIKVDSGFMTSSKLIMELYTLKQVIFP